MLVAIANRPRSNIPTGAAAYTRLQARPQSPHLFGQWAVVREWGRIGSPVGQRLEQWFDDPAAAHAFMNQLEKSKRHRGYH